MFEKVEQLYDASTKNLSVTLQMVNDPRMKCVSVHCMYMDVLNCKLFFFFICRKNLSLQDY